MVELVTTGCIEDPVTIVQLIFDACILDNGVSCNAANPCLNTYYTCQDKCSFECGVKEVWLTSCELPWAMGVTNYTPKIISVDNHPASCKIGDITSTRANFRVCVSDLPDCDGAVQGWLSKLLKAQKWVRNRRMNVWQGDCSQQLCEMQKYEYFIDRYTGPVGSDCLIYLDGKDVLNFALGNNITCPAPQRFLSAANYFGEPGETTPQLAVPLDDADDEGEPFLQLGQFLLSTNLLMGDKAQDRAILGTRYLCLGDEVIEVEPCVNDLTNPVGFNYKLVDRAVCGSELNSHEAGDTLSIPKWYCNMHVADVIRDLLENCAELSEVAQLCCTEEKPYLINQEALELYKCKRPLDIITNTVICESESVSTLLEELSREFMLAIYPKNGMVHVEAICPPEDKGALPVITEEMIFEGTLSADRTDEAYNRVFYAYDTINCAKGKEKSNLRSSVENVSIDLANEPCDRKEMGSINSLSITSRWINRSNAYLAHAYTARYLRWFKCPAQEVRMEVPTSIANCLDLNDYAYIEHPKVADWKDEYGVVWALKEVAATRDPACTQLRFRSTPFEETYLQCFTCEPGPNGEPPPMIAAPVPACEEEFCSMRMF